MDILGSSVLDTRRFPVLWAHQTDSRTVVYVFAMTRFENADLTHQFLPWLVMSRDASFEFFAGFVCTGDVLPKCRMS